MRALMTIAEGAGLTFFHGTSSARLPSIMQHGLTPHTDPGSRNRNNASTINGWTEKNVYLSTSATEAQRYAEMEANHTGGTPVVLAVTVPDQSKLVPDDDFIIDATTIVMAQENGWEPEGDAWDISNAHEASDNYSGISQAVQIALVAPLERIADAAYYDVPYARRLKDAVLKAMQTPWQEALAARWNNGSVAYQGAIPPGMLSIVRK
jgi:hypothetical protein